MASALKYTFTRNHWSGSVVKYSLTDWRARALDLLLDNIALPMPNCTDSSLPRRGLLSHYRNTLSLCLLGCITLGMGLITINAIVDSSWRGKPICDSELNGPCRCVQRNIRSDNTAPQCTMCEPASKNRFPLFLSLSFFFFPSQGIQLSP